jgi:tetratricopeptide (TPR) repeat protein
MLQEEDKPSLEVYKRVTAFVGHSFDKKDHDLVIAIKCLLASLGVTCDSGEKAEGRSISKKILERIKRNELFVGIFTRKTKLSGKDDWTTSNWIVEEKAAAINAKKKLLLLVEEGVTDIGGLQGDYEYVRFDRSRLYEALPKVIDYIRSFTVSEIRLDKEHKISTTSLVRQLEREESNINDYLVAADKCLGNGNPKDAEEILRKGLKRFSNSTEIKGDLANVLRCKGQFDESRKLFESVLVIQPKNPKFHHNYAHLLEQTGDLDKALEHFQIALDLDPSVPRHFSCYGKCLYGKAMSISNEVAKKETLKKARRLMGSAQKFGDEKINKETAGYILHIDSHLENEN